MRRSSTSWHQRRGPRQTEGRSRGWRRLLLRSRLLWLRARWPAWLPRPVREVLFRLREKASPETYLVGGPVRDLLLGRPVHDWDLATAAPPASVQALFERTVETGLAHGTVTVLVGARQVEVTSFRSEGPYLDGRRPSSVSFGVPLEADLGRRDFTINAMALGPAPPAARIGTILGLLHDPYGGLGDLARRVVRAVGDPALRFQEDHLRVMRAFRIAAELGFAVEEATAAAAAAASPDLSDVSAERMRAELDRILLSPRAGWCLEQMCQAGVVGVVLPELQATVGFQQNEYHPLDAWQHSALAADAIEPRLHLRWAALLHDAGKPGTLSVDSSGGRHFYGHEALGAELAERVLTRLRYETRMIRRVVHLVRVHMDLHELPEEAGDAAVRRVAARIGRENIGDLLRLRRADRLATGRPGPVSPGTLRLLERLAWLERAGSALGIADLKIDGHGVMAATGLEPGPDVGRILRGLLEAVIRSPALNNREDLTRLARELAAGGDSREPSGGTRSDPSV